MTGSRAIQFAIAVATLLAPLSAIEAQITDTVQVDSTFDIRSFWRNRGDRNGLTITSGKAYNRVEGLPIMLGPNFRGDFGRITLRMAVLGIYRDDRCNSRRCLSLVGNSAGTAQSTRQAGEPTDS